MTPTGEATAEPFIARDTHQRRPDSDKVTAQHLRAMLQQQTARAPAGGRLCTAQVINDLGQHTRRIKAETDMAELAAVTCFSTSTVRKPGLSQDTYMPRSRSAAAVHAS